MCNCAIRILATVTALVIAMSTAWSDATYSEPFRPQFHFTPERNWMNDPNGLVFSDGQYHLFYQYNPQGNKWGHMSWGHAVSTDLIHWKPMPLALPESGDIMAFSGSAVVDSANTSGFGENGKAPLVAIYTGHNGKAKRQAQYLAYSNDGGRTWTQFSGNPILDIQSSDFRDPKVFWYEPNKCWVMAVVLSTEKKVRLYKSSDLKSWTQLSEFGPAGSSVGVWECPDFFPLPVAGEPGTQKWVMLVNVNPGGPTGGSGCQYFVGDFDGQQFTADSIFKQASDTNAATPAPPSSTAPAPAADAANQTVINDFEGGDYGDWTTTGTAFGAGPVHPQGTSDVTGYHGTGFVDSFGGDDSAVGTLTSPEFTITGNTISFLIGGGSHPELGIKLMVEGEQKCIATGNNSPALQQQSWDVSAFKGKKGQIVIFDNYDKSDWGHIFVDYIVMSDSPQPAAGAPAPSAPSGSPGASNGAGDGKALWLDHGSDFYAAATWNGIPDSDGRRLLIAWMNSWSYGQDIPTDPWRSAMTVPRALSLVRTSAGLRLAQSPVAELEKLRGDPSSFSGGSFVDAVKWLSSLQDLPKSADVEINFSGVTANTPFAINLNTGPNECTTLVFDLAAGKVSLDRTQSGNSSFHSGFAAVHDAPLEAADGKVSVRILQDASSLEVFCQQGTSVITDQIFPTGSTRTMGLAMTGAAGPNVDSIKIYRLASAWAENAPALSNSQTSSNP